MLSLSIQAWVALTILAASFAVMIKAGQKIPVYLVFMVGAIMLVLTGCIDMKTAMEGFSSSTIVLIAGLFLSINGLENTGFMNVVATKLLRRPRSLSSAIVRVMLPASFLSGFMSNTAVTALFINVVKHLAKEMGIAPSKLLMPMSYAAILGGTLLLIGNPINLLIAEQYKDYSGNTLNITFPTIAGVFIVICGVVSVLCLQKLLPTRKSPEEELGAGHSAVTELMVPASCPFIGDTLGESLAADWVTGTGSCRVGQGTSLKDPALLGIIRFDGEIVKNVEKDEFLMGGDTLLLTGPKEKILHTGKKLGMMCSIMEKEVSERDRRKMPLAVILILAAIVLPVLDILSAPITFLMVALVMLATGIIKVGCVLSAMKGELMIIIACSAAYGKAIEQTGIAQSMADSICSVSSSDPLVALVIICTLGTFLTEFLSNVGCAAILTPVALSLSTTLGANPLTFCLGLMISCCCSFATPMGTVPNLIIYVPGGYKFTDYTKIGLPMNILMLIANIFIVTLLFPL